MKPSGLSNSTKIALLFVVFLTVIALALYLATVVEQYPGNGYREITPVNPTLTPETNLYAASDNAFPQIMAAAAGWAADYRVISCAGTPGALNGYYRNWTCFIYSASKHADTTVVLENGYLQVNTEHLDYNLVTGASDPAARNYFDLTNLISSSQAYRIALDNGFNAGENLAILGIGLASSQGKYGSRAVWEVREVSRNNPETVTRIYYIDATSALLLSVINL